MKVMEKIKSDWLGFIVLLLDITLTVFLLQAYFSHAQENELGDVSVPEVPTEEVPTDEEVSTDSSTTTESDDLDLFQMSTDEASSTESTPNEVISLSAQEQAEQILKINDTNLVISEIPEKQEQIYNLISKYQQVRNYVNVYQSKNGWGYQTIQITPTKVIYIGYGSQAQDYTYTTDIITPVASSTDIF